MKIGDTIRKYRKKLGLTQTQLADILGTTQYVITNYERNLRKPSADKIPAIAKVLEITLDEFYEIESSDNEKVRTAHNTRTKQMQEVFPKLSAAEQRVILKQVKGMVE